MWYLAVWYWWLQDKYREADMIITNLFIFLGQSRQGKAMVLKGLTWLSGIVVIAARVLTMLVAAIFILFLIWTLFVDYFHRNVK